MAQKRVLVLCIDVDNDVGRKAGFSGPLTGKKANLEAATHFALADPEDSDVNTMFEAIRVFDQLKKEDGVKAELCTLTGSERGGFYADREVATQLDKVLGVFPAESCVLISDGASDDQLLPLIQSRLRIDSVVTVTVKQTKELEQTYFVILEKLKEPHFARIVFGIPAILLLLLAFADFFGVRVFLALFGGYLLLKATGLEDRVIKAFSSFNVAVDNQTFIFNFASSALVIVSVLLGFSNAFSASDANLLQQAAFFLKGLFPLFPIALFLYLVGDSLRALKEKKMYLLPKQVLFASGLLLAWLVLNDAAQWVLGEISFADFFYSLILIVVAMYLFTLLSGEFKRSILAKLKLEGKDVYTEIGGLVGKIVDIDRRKETFIIRTRSGQNIDLDFDHISDLGENVIIRY